VPHRGLTAQQQHVLEQFDDRWRDLDDLAARAGVRRSGLGQTLSSLERRGLTERFYIAGRVRYRATLAGAAER
jgi:hypothetical protein